MLVADRWIGSVSINSLPSGAANRRIAFGSSRRKDPPVVGTRVHDCRWWPDPRALPCMQDAPLAARQPPVSKPDPHTQASYYIP